MKMWRCRCVCGNEVQVETTNLKRRAQSCGCKKGEKISKKLAGRRWPDRPPRKSWVIPGAWYREYPLEYGSWKSMITRSRRPQPKDAKVYHGVFVCERWKSFPNLLEDMGRRPSRAHTLDRKDNRKGYEKDNCRWATKKEQSQNRRNVRMLTFDGKTQCVADWAREIGMSPKILYQRIKQRLPLEMVLCPHSIPHSERRRPKRAA